MSRCVPTRRHSDTESGLNPRRSRTDRRGGEGGTNPIVGGCTGPLGGFRADRPRGRYLVSFRGALGGRGSGDGEAGRFAFFALEGRAAFRGQRTDPAEGENTVRRSSQNMNVFVNATLHFYDPPQESS